MCILILTVYPRTVCLVSVRCTMRLCTGLCITVCSCVCRSVCVPVPCCLCTCAFLKGGLRSGIFCSSICSTSCGKFVCRNVPIYWVVYLFYTILCHGIMDGPYSCLFLRMFIESVDMWLLVPVCVLCSYVRGFREQSVWPTYLYRNCDMFVKYHCLYTRS